jgi:hypothetical protein
MCWRIREQDGVYGWGLEGIAQAIECKNVATCEYSSGLQVSGVFTEVITDEDNSPIYLRTTGKTALAFRTKNSKATASIIWRRLLRRSGNGNKHPHHLSCSPTINCTRSDC